MIYFNFRSCQNSYLVQILFERYNFFSFNSIKNNYSPKWKTKKQKKNYKKDRESIIHLFLKMRKF